MHGYELVAEKPQADVRDAHDGQVFSGDPAGQCILCCKRAGPAIFVSVVVPPDRQKVRVWDKTHRKWHSQIHASRPGKGRRAWGRRSSPIEAAPHL